MNYKKVTTVLLLVGAFFAHTMHSKTVEFIENMYHEQAPQDVVELIEKVATQVGYTTPYEIAVAKKAGLQVNPWNKTIHVAEVSAQVKRPVVMVNPSWLTSLPAEQQTFLIARCFTTLEKGASPWYITYGMYMYIAFVYLLMALLFVVLRRKSPLKMQKAWISAVVAVLVVTAVDLACIKGAFQKTQQYVADRYNVQSAQATLAKTGDRDAAVQALMAFDAVVKEGVNNGEQVFVPFKDSFETLANAVRESQE